MVRALIKEPEHKLTKTMVRVLERIQEHLAYDEKTDGAEEFMCYALSEAYVKMRPEAYELLSKKFKHLLILHGISTGGSLGHMIRKDDGTPWKYVNGYATGYSSKAPNPVTQCWRFDFLQLLICEATL